jgi:hypothetical protein
MRRQRLATCRATTPVFVHELFLPIPPHARCRLLVVGGVPVAIKQDKTVGTDQIEAATTSCSCETNEVHCEECNKLV